MTDAGYAEAEYGGVTVLAAANGGYYPAGNSLLVRGSDRILLVDPSTALLGSAPPADLVFVSHAHEDHMVDLAGFTDADVLVHQADLESARSRASLLASYGMGEGYAAEFEPTLVSEFHVADRPDARAVTDGHRIELGGVSATVLHLPGHTPGHCGLLIEPDGFLFVADIDLSSFGPYYGDLGSDLCGFEDSIRRCGEVDARWYGTFHQKGVIDGAEEFRCRLAAYLGVIRDREARMLEYLAEPRTISEMVEHRFVYRAHVDEPYVVPVERRTAQRHVQRLLAEGAVTEVEPGRFRAVSG